MTRYLFALVMLSVLAGCKSDGSSQDIPDASLPVQSGANMAPVISGSPARLADVGRGYAFRPQAQDPNGDALTFSVVNKPVWAQFDPATGELSGQPAPTQVGRYSGIIIAVSDGKAHASMPGFAIDVVDADLTPTIVGQPATTVTVGNAYRFIPSASDPGGAALTFNISNAPTWAEFDETTGQLTGSPGAGDVGTSSNIIIGVSNGTQSSTLPAFSIVVYEAGSAHGSATLSWVPPTQNTDGSTLTDLAGYKIYYGTDSSSLNKVISVKSAGISSYVISGLASATWYFSVKAYSATNLESALSEMVSKTIN